jgi:hypothetical protein
MAQVSLHRFVEYLELARVFDQRYPHMDQTGWLFDHWCFDDQRAYYGQEPLSVYGPWWVEARQNGIH